ncbi:MAG: hypothetical protein WCI71_02145 [Bacteroidota bacterium]
MKSHINDYKHVTLLTNLPVNTGHYGVVINRSKTSSVVKAVSEGGEAFEWTLEPGELLPVKVRRVISATPGENVFMLWNT